ncbi:hypothetical protein CERZMDRAFT_90561 [Cercospora zeae-maydis SCOH1-5]|uniref:Uncharacterized protein n=1 Tax=Cercospora zeae-maydis SCOH1-5 TaxID=717836 RepID=A0A6A6FI85_9PEZI|nr:hypothetical protein CERZMDRAFT_90561 [Cercospora zeae-maydis SCOH1-5]
MDLLGEEERSHPCSVFHPQDARYAGLTKIVLWVKSMIGNGEPASAGTWHGWEASSSFACLDSNITLDLRSGYREEFSFALFCS